MKCLNSQFYAVKATEQDNEDIKQILLSDVSQGSIQMQTLRGTNPFVSYQKEGEPIIVIVREKKTHKAVLLGLCIVRFAYVKGELKRVGYLAGLKIIPEYQKKMVPLAKAYAYLYELCQDKVDFYYSTIVAENNAMQKMMEKKRKNCPEYQKLGAYTVYYFQGLQSAKNLKTINKKHIINEHQYVVRKVHYAEIEDFYKRESSHYALSMINPSDNVLQEADFYALYDSNTVLGVGYLLNQIEYKQLIVRRYKGLYAFLSKIPKRILSHCLQFPLLPHLNKPMDVLYSQIFVKDNSVQLARDLLLQMRAYIPRDMCIMIGLHEKDTLNDIFSQIRHVKYKSLLYHIEWKANQEQIACLENQIIKLDVAFL